ncbi:hypothetical protein [Nocardiopsis tropica]|uniref:FtsK domain-containing protein n=1 Tax=Nocardiopsis tropica TaxID=109330 RepID=A0ABU7KQT8_9ACTN|nr:hypothetical protein [Nocardiopsis umidischolae]MEE2051656.1 hypothetical protein [Nocardiopsis umidischolae]
MGKKKQKKTVEWGHYGPISGPFTAACTSLAVAGWGDVVGLSPWYAVAGAGACGLLTLAMDVKRKLPVFARVTHLGAWVFHGWWTWGALAASTPYSVDGIATLATGTAVAVVAAQAASVHTENVREHLALVAEEERKDGIAGEWISRISRVCNIKGVKVPGIDPWKRPVPGSPGETRETGYSLTVELPSGGYRWTDISSKRLELVSDANLTTGCGIEVRAGGTAREVIIDITTVNVLAEDLPLPGDFDKATFYDPIRFGITPDGQYAEVSLKWASGILIGQKRSGKSNQLVTLMSQILACDDVLIWGIDFKGGGVFKPYLKPWLTGEVDRPAIDWVATDEQEAIRMLDMAIAGIPARVIGYDELMDSEDDDKVPSSHQVPHILFITDETNNMPRSIKDRLVAVSNVGGGASVSTLVCALRAVDAGGNGLPIELNAQARVKMSMQVDGDQELAYLFNWGKAPRCEEIPGVGFGVYGEEGGIPRLFKGFRAKPSAAKDAAVKTADRRPVLDEVTRNVQVDGEYDSRWERAKATWLAGKQAPQRAATGASQGASADPFRPTPGGPTPDPSRAGDVAEEAARKAFADAGLPYPGDAPQEPQPPSDDGFDGIASDTLSDLQVPRLLTVGRDMAAEEGLVPMADLAARFGLTSQRLGKLLRQVGVEPRQSPWRGARAYEQEAFVLVIEGIRSGHLAAPDEVWAASPVE